MWSAGAGAVLDHPRGGGTLSLTLCAQSLAGMATAAATRERTTQAESDRIAGPGPERMSRLGARNPSAVLYSCSPRHARSRRELRVMDWRQQGQTEMSPCQFDDGLTQADSPTDDRPGNSVRLNALPLFRSQSYVRMDLPRTRPFFPSSASCCPLSRLWGLPLVDGPCRHILHPQAPADGRNVWVRYRLPDREPSCGR